MSTVINTNTTAFNASLALNQNSNNLSTDIERLSTGMQINSASDNPAGLVITNNMSAQLSGLNQATANSNDAVNMVKTASSALTQVQTLLTQIRQLAVQASNTGANSTVEVQADQTEINAAIASINRISSTTQFGTKNLLDGSATSNATVGAGSATSSGSDLSILAQGSWSVANTYNYVGASTTISAATATTAASTASASVAAATWGGSITINGVSYTIAAGSSLVGLNTAIQGSGYSLGVAGANLTFTNTATGAPTSPQTFNLGALTNSVAATYGAVAVTNGTNEALTLNDGGGHTLTSVNTTSSGTTNTYTFANGLVISSAVAAGSHPTSNITPVAGASTFGNSLEFQIGANEGQTTSVNIQSIAAAQLGLNAASYTDANGNAQTVLTQSLAGVNVSTFKGAQDAIAVVDKAINDVSTVSANLGALQSDTLQSNITSLGVATSNLQASQSSIEDTNMASQIVDYTKNQILVQASTSALAYANQMPQYVLKLLQ